MKKNLNLCLDPGTIAFAKKYASMAHTSVSKIVEEHFNKLKGEAESGLLPELEALRGILEGREYPEKQELRRIYHEGRIN